MRRWSLSLAPILCFVAAAPVHGRNLWPAEAVNVPIPATADRWNRSHFVDCRFGQVLSGRAQVRTQGADQLGLSIFLIFDSGPGTRELGRGALPTPDQSPDWSGTGLGTVAILGAVPRGATRARLAVLVHGRHRDEALVQGITFQVLPEPALPNLWPHGSTNHMAATYDGSVPMRATAIAGLREGEVFTGECLALPASCQARIGLRFDTGEGTPVLGTGEAMGPDRPDAAPKTS